MICTAFISFASSRGYSEGTAHTIGASAEAKIASMVVFSILGVPLAVSTATLCLLVFKLASLAVQVG